MKDLTLDPTTMAVLFSWPEQIVDEMDDSLCMSAFSPTISEGYDRADGIYSNTGDPVVQGRCFLQAVKVLAMIGFVIFTAKALAFVFHAAGIIETSRASILGLPFGNYGILAIFCIMHLNSDVFL